jgi:hypothetical protein
MNSEYPSPQGKSFIPLTLLSISVIVLFASQLKNVSQARDSVQSSKQKMDDFVTVNVPKLEDALAKSKQGEDVLQKLVVDLLELSKTDDAAKAVVAKYGIKQQAPAGTPAPSANP